MVKKRVWHWDWDPMIVADIKYPGAKRPPRKPGPKRTPNAEKRRRARAKALNNDNTRAQQARDYIEIMIHRGWTKSDIASELGVSRRALYNWLETAEQHDLGRIEGKQPKLVFIKLLQRVHANNPPAWSRPAGKLEPEPQD